MGFEPTCNQTKVSTVYKTEPIFPNIKWTRVGFEPLCLSASETCSRYTTRPIYKLSHLRESNFQPAVYKTAAPSIELKWHLKAIPIFFTIENICLRARAFSELLRYRLPHRRVGSPCKTRRNSCCFLRIRTHETEST